MEETGQWRRSQEVTVIEFIIQTIQYNTTQCNAIQYDQ